MTLVPLEESQAYVLARVGPIEPAPVDLGDCVGLALADDVVAAEPVPPFANSAMDGYAVRSADVAAATPADPIELKVVGEQPAGPLTGARVGAGEAVRIMTGAGIPAGADAIVIVEHTETRGDVVVVREPAGEHIRPAGGDVAVGDLVFPAGTEIGPAHVGVLATLGMAKVSVRRPSVAVLSTGDELVGPGEPLTPGAIRESNGPMLAALLERTGCATSIGVVADDEVAIEAALTDAMATHDAVVTSGGVSMGEYDFVKVVLDRIADTRWFQIAIRPAKPFTFGVAAAPDGRSVPIFGLPGNPVSSFVSFEVLVRPALRRMMGHRDLHRPVVRAVAAADLTRRPDGKTHLDRVRVWHDAGRLMAERSGIQASNVLTAMALANGLAFLPDGDGAAAGEEVDVMLLDLPRTLAP